MSAQKEQKQRQQITYFEKQRDALISEIAISMDSVLNNVNALNRSLEGSIAVGKEFDSVSSLWSNFYDGLAQVEQLRAQQNPEDADENHQEQQPESHDQDMRSDVPVSDGQEEENRMDVEQEPLNENVELDEQPINDS